MRSNLNANHLSDPFITDGLRLASTTLALSATLTMEAGATPVQLLDPNGAGKTVLLPPESRGLTFLIWNKADAAEDLTIKDDSNTTTILTVSQNEAGVLYCDGTSWHRALLSAAAT